MACTVCTAKTELFLCRTHTDEVRGLLTGLVRGPELRNGHHGSGWLTFLIQAATGQTRLGESAGRSTDKGSPMLCNLRASDLLDDVRNMLTTWIRDLCETRGIECEPLMPSEVSMAAWLLAHVDGIALHPAADEFLDELKQRVREIERMINRPEPSLAFGRCPTMLTIGNGTRQCDALLSADREAIEIQCRGCKTTFEVKTLIRQRLDEVAGWLFNAREVLDIMAAISEPVPARTWQHWRREGIVKSRSEWDAEPKYLISDVRDARAGVKDGRRKSRPSTVDIKCIQKCV